MEKTISTGQGARFEKELREIFSQSEAVEIMAGPTSNHLHELKIDWEKTGHKARSRRTQAAIVRKILNEPKDSWAFYSSLSGWIKTEEEATSFLLKMRKK